MLLNHVEPTDDKKSQEIAHFFLFKRLLSISMAACASQKMIGKEITAMIIAHPPNFGRRMINTSAAANPDINGLNILFIFSSVIPLSPYEIRNNG
jgi:hypothetical protein